MNLKEAFENVWNEFDKAVILQDVTFDAETVSAINPCVIMAVADCIVVAVKKLVLRLQNEALEDINTLVSMLLANILDELILLELRLNNTDTLLKVANTDVKLHDVILDAVKLLLKTPFEPVKILNAKFDVVKLLLNTPFEPVKVLTDRFDVVKLLLKTPFEHVKVLSVILDPSIRRVDTTLTVSKLDAVMIGAVMLVDEMF